MPTAILLDVTRSLRRAGGVLTGIDRVELAYLRYFLLKEGPIFGLARTAFGYVLLDRNGLSAFEKRVAGQHAWGPASFLSRLAVKRENAAIKAESDIRRLSVSRCIPSKLTAMLCRRLPADTDYYNVGHSNLSTQVLEAAAQAGCRTHAMIHDVIPLEFPQFQRDATVQPFREKIMRVSARAHRVIYVTEDTRRKAEQVMLACGRVPPATVAHLGINTVHPDVDALPSGRPARPYFVTVGTIEPRKNHAFLLDLWSDMGPDAPPLMMCGSRGWNNEALFDRLDNLPPDGPVKEVGGLTDPALAALVQQASGLLFPTFAEGFGLPPVEALCLGTRVLCNDLAVLHEVLGESAVYASLGDRSLWINTIKQWATQAYDKSEGNDFKCPSWADHFNVVLSSG